jgi:hypothetical protein
MTPIRSTTDTPGEVEVIPTTVQANLINKFRGVYEPHKERVYYRNDGLKHVKSRGDKC